MALVLAATGCVNPMNSVLNESVSRSQPPATPSPTAPTASSAMPAMFGRPAPTQASLARKAVVAWNNQIVITNDPVNNNRPLPGIAGRLYVFGDDEGHPLDVPGTVSVAVHAMDKDGKTGPVLVAWNIDSASLQRLARRDAIGHGYTLFLPWPEYQPDIVRVRLDVRYVPDGGQPLFTPSETLSLHPDTTPLVNTSQLVPASQMPPPTPQLNRKQ
jgi:hypothetical protein